MQKYLVDYLNFWPHPINTIYIIGSGPSLRLFPTKFFDDKYTIGLNEAYKLVQCTINITIHPKLIPKLGNNLWLTKPKDNVDVSRYYQFQNEENYNLLKRSSLAVAPNSLYCSRGIQTSALHLASRLGASYAVLAGCDMGSLAGDHHAIPSPCQLHGYTFNQVYKEYYFHTVKVAELLEEEYGMKTISISSLLGEICREEDYKHQLERKKLKPFGEPQIIETAKRVTPLTSNYL